MGKVTLAERIATTYAAFRGSSAFFLLLTVWFATATLTHALFGWDPGYNDTVYYLSWEATYASAFLMMVMEKMDHVRLAHERERREAEARDRLMTERLLTISQATLSQMKTNREILDHLNIRQREG